MAGQSEIALKNTKKQNNGVIVEMKNKIKTLLLFIYCVAVCFFVCYSNYQANSTFNTNNQDATLDSLNNLADNGFTIIPEHSHWVEFENYGLVKFVPGYRNKTDPPGIRLDFCLVDSDNMVLYEFPDAYANEWIFFEIQEISFQDVNGNGETDVVITAYYMVGHGERAGMPFSVSIIYYQNNMEFITNIS